MAAFPDTGSPMSNARQVWDSGQIDQGIYQMDFGCKPPCMAPSLFNIESMAREFRLQGKPVL